MGHRIDRCDIVDVLEEAVVARSAVAVELQTGGRFTDQVRDVVTENGEDYAIFKDHARVAVTEIAAANRADPIEASYDSKASAGKTPQNG